MADISKIRVNDTEYDIKDAVARAQSGGSVLAGYIDGGQTFSFTGDSAYGILEYFDANSANYVFGIFWVQSNGYINMDDPLFASDVEIQKDGDVITINPNGPTAWYIVFNATQA